MLYLVQPKRLWDFISLPPALAEEVIFSVASVCVGVSVCVSVCTLQAEPLAYGPKIWRTH